MVAISELSLPEADAAALDASLWAWRAAGIDAALTTWNEVLERTGAAGAPVTAAPESTDSATPDRTAPDPAALLPPAGNAVPDPYGMGGRVPAPSGVEAVTVVPGLRRIECLVDDTVDYEELWKSLRGLTSAEWTACVLTALGRMAGAQEGLRGTAVRLQGWWRDEDREVHFTADQVC